MNLLEYRAMKEAESNQAEGGEVVAQTEQVSTESVQPVVQETVETQSTPPHVETETTTQAEPNQIEEPQTFEINGEKVSLEELQRGYLRQSDYTKKTQEVAKHTREIEQARELMQALQQKPEVAQELGFDPQQQYTQSLEQNYYDLLLQQEIGELSTKYNDFEVSDVLNFAHENNLQNLEHAYLLHKQYAPPKVNNAPITPTAQTVDVEALKAQIRAELQNEMNTSTIISGGGNAPTPQSDVQLTPDELKVAKAFRMTPDEYAKWRQ